MKYFKLHDPRYNTNSNIGLNEPINLELKLCKSTNNSCQSDYRNLSMHVTRPRYARNDLRLWTRN